MDKGYFIMFIVVAVVFVHCSFATERWTQPCGNSRWVISNNTLPEQVIEEIYNKLYSAKLWTAKLKGDYAILRIGSPIFIEILKSITHSGFPTTVSKNQSGLDLQKMLPSFLQDYEHLSIVAVFLEKAKLDEITYDHGYFESTYSDIENALYSALCSLSNLIRILGSNVSSHVTRDVMSEELRSYSNVSIERYCREFITLKDSHLYFSELSSKFHPLF